MKKLLIFFLLLILLSGFVIAKVGDWIIQGIFSGMITRFTGFKTAANSLHLDFSRGTIHVQGLVLLNPELFQERIFADIPEIYLEMGLPALLKRERIYLKRLRLVIRELNIEKNKQGISNISLLLPAKPKKEKSSPPFSSSEPQERKTALPFYLDQLELTLRQVSYYDQSKLVPAKVSLDMRIEREIFQGIENPASIVNLILLKVLTRSPLGNLGLDPSELSATLEKTVQKTLMAGEEFLKGQTTVIARKAGTALNQVEEVTREQLSEILGRVKTRLGVSQKGSQNQ